MSHVTFRDGRVSSTSRRRDPAYSSIVRTLRAPSPAAVERTRPHERSGTKAKLPDYNIRQPCRPSEMMMNICWFNHGHRRRHQHVRPAQQPPAALLTTHRRPSDVPRGEHPARAWQPHERPVQAFPSGAVKAVRRGKLVVTHPLGSADRRQLDRPRRGERTGSGVRHGGRRWQRCRPCVADGSTLPGARGQSDAVDCRPGAQWRGSGLALFTEST